MKVRFGTLEIDVEVDKHVGDILELRIKDLIKANVEVRYIKPEKLVSPTMKTEMVKRLVQKIQDHDHTKNVRILNEVGITEKMIQMISGEKNLKHAFHDASRNFLTRPLTEKVWALYVGPVEVPYYGMKVAVVGLTTKNQLDVLALEDGPPVRVLKKCVERGLDPAGVKLGILSFELGAAEELKETFPQAQVALDWQELLDMAPPDTRLVIRKAMLTDDKEKAAALVQALKAPRELLTYYNYPSTLWRSLRTIYPVRRIEKELRHNLKSKKLKGYHDRDLVLNWTLLKMQYYWAKIPADSPHLSNLTYVRRQEEERRITP